MSVAAPAYSAVTPREIPPATFAEDGDDGSSLRARANSDPPATPRTAAPSKKTEAPRSRCPRSALSI
jgi:hypothetical protein